MQSEKRKKPMVEPMVESEWKAWRTVALSEKVLQRPQAMVFEGGGVLGLAYAQAIAVADQKGALVNTTHWAGSSAGSLCASLMACGATPEYLERQLEQINLGQLKDDDSGILRDIWRLYWNGGVAKGAKLSQWIGKCLYDLTGDEFVTFEQQYKRNEHVQRIYTSSLTEQRCLIFDCKATPKATIKDALVASCSYPLVFPLVKYEHHVLWDGGVLNNYPIDAFDEWREVTDDQPFPRWPNQKGTLGMKLILPEEAVKKPIKKSVNNVFDAVKTMVTSWRDATLNMHINTHIDWPRTMPINIEQSLSVMQFDISEDQKAMLKRSGRDSALAYFTL